MKPQVRVRFLEGPHRNKEIAFDEHDVLLFGREADCHVRLMQDAFISRHHLIMEIRPPQVFVRDLNSLNGIVINGVAYGGRVGAAETAQGTATEPIALVDADKIRLGQTLIQVMIQQGDTQRVSIRCTMCGRTLMEEEDLLQGADYLCEQCGKRAESDPNSFLKTMVRNGITVRGHGAGGNITNYKVIERLGQGGMGAAYLAERKTDGAKVVLKVLHSRLAAQRQNRETFLREMSLLAGLQHPNTVKYLSYGAAGATFFFVLEYCNSGTLLRLNARNYGRVPWQETLPIFRETLRGLAYAHERKIVHRDIKPDNIFLHQESGKLVPKIGDFGLAKNFSLAGLTQLTQPGEYAGSFLYMSKEQLENFKFAQPTVDVWSVAATFYFVLTGQYPREMPQGKDPIDVIMDDVLTPIEQRGVEMPPRLAAAINRGIVSDPSKRWQHAGEFLKVIEAVA